MNNIFHALILGALQGATEFLPVSSSGHLVIVPWLLGWQQPNLTFDIVVHWGTLLALIIFFRNDVTKLFFAVLRVIRNMTIKTNEERLAICIVIGSLPAAIIGISFEKYFEEIFASPSMASVFLLVTACILMLSEKLSKRSRPISNITFSDAWMIGFAQAFAILPGISRSGSTIAAGLARNLQRETAARYSFLLGIPVIFGAGLVQLPKLFLATHKFYLVPSMVGAFFSSFIIGYISIKILMNYVKTKTLYPFALYCAIFGIITLILNLLK